MKIIHSADQHIDSKINSYLPEDKAAERRRETLATFIRMVDYARDNDVNGILLAGDLFDTAAVSKNVQISIRDVILNNPTITFYYLRGNHDTKSLDSSIFSERPDNLKFFDKNWKSYHLTDKIVITGIELDADNYNSLYDNLKLNEDNINICMLHGQIGTAVAENVICTRMLQNNYIDYLALGHIHSYRRDNLDARGIMCYSGCLEGRGFDEAGEKGFVLLDIDENTGKIRDEFIAFASRKINYFEIDSTGANSDLDVEKIINETIDRNNLSSKDIVDIRLTGHISEETNIDEGYLQKRFEERFYYIRIKNRLKIKIEYDKYIKDPTLKGEFMRLVMNDESLSEDDKGEIIMLGFKALRQESLDDYIKVNN